MKSVSTRQGTNATLLVPALVLVLGLSGCGSKDSDTAAAVNAYSKVPTSNLATSDAKKTDVDSKRVAKDMYGKVPTQHLKK